MTFDQRQAEVERSWRSLIHDDRQDADTEELRRLFFGSALPQEPSTNAATEWEAWGGQRD